MKNFNKNKTAGFTIIEMMIATSIFLIVVVIGVGAVLNGNMVHNKSKDLRSIMDSLSFVMEDMSRNIRTGYDYSCDNGLLFTGPQDCTDLDALSFTTMDTNTTGDPTYYQWIYKISGDKVFKSVQPKGSPASEVQMTPDEITIDSSKSGFSVMGAGGSPDTRQPIVVINLSGEILYQGTKTPFSLQTSVSQRVNDF